MVDVRLAMALLAASALTGCIGGLDDPDARASEGPLVLEASADRRTLVPGERVTVRASLSNQGLSAPEVRDGCQNALELELVGPEGVAVRTGPEVGSCAAYSTTRLWPGQSVTEPLRWNGTTYDRDEGYQPAPVGEYTVRIEGETESRGGGHSRSLGPIEVSFEVHPTES